MSVFLQPLQTVTVGSGGVASVTFSNIPQTYTDLMLQTSLRTNYAAVDDWDNAIFNSDTSGNYSFTYLYGNGSTTGSGRTASNVTLIELTRASGANATPNTFGSSTAYIANYTSSNAKQIIVEDISESNISSGVTQQMIAALYRGSAISSITLSPANGTLFTQYSTFSLYGILRQGI
jgi:hypothetical protein